MRRNPRDDVFEARLAQQRVRGQERRMLKNEDMKKYRWLSTGAFVVGVVGAGLCGFFADQASQGMIAAWPPAFPLLVTGAVLLALWAVIAPPLITKHGQRRVQEKASVPHLAL